MIDRERLRSGDHQYFAEIIRSFGPVVRLICLAYGDSEDEADDLRQEVWTLVYQKRRTYRGDGPFSAWLGRLTTRHCIDNYRKKRASRRGLESLVARGGLKGIHSGSPDPGEYLERKTAERNLWEALDALPGKEREAIVLRLLERRSPTEVATQMKIEKASVRSNISRGIRRLKGIMGEEQT